MIEWELKVWSRQESNLDLELRKLLYYPLYYEAGVIDDLNLRFQIELNLCSFYFINPGALAAKTLTAIASKITPKNFRTAINPAFPNTFSIRFRERITR